MLLIQRKDSFFCVYHALFPDRKARDVFLGVLSLWGFFELERGV
jgi:hypothetical protein